MYKCDGPTDLPTDQRTDRAECRVACTRLKTQIFMHFLNADFCMIFFDLLKSPSIPTTLKMLVKRFRTEIRCEET